MWGWLKPLLLAILEFFSKESRRETPGTIGDDGGLGDSLSDRLRNDAGDRGSSGERSDSDRADSWSDQSSGQT